MALFVLLSIQFVMAAFADVPTITTPPSNQTVALGGTAIFTASASGSEPLSYRWQFNNVGLTNGGGVSGSTTSTLMLTGVGGWMAGSYRVLVTNPEGTAISPAAILAVPSVVPLPEALDTDGTALVWTTGGDVPWSGQDLVTHDGVDAARSGVVPDAGSSSLQTVVAGPGTVSFWWKVSSEVNNDRLRFYLNGTEQARISGEVQWGQQSFTVPAGVQMLQWRYSKNGSLAAGQDRAWVDQVQFTPSGCPVSLSPMDRVHDAAAATAIINVTIPAGCPWTVFNSNAWLTITSSLNNSGNGVVTYVVSANAGAVTRSGNILLAGQIFAISQTGTAPAPSIQMVNFSPHDGASLLVRGQAGRTHVVESSGDLVHWTSINTNIMPATICPSCPFVTVNDDAATNFVRRFYRAVEIP